MTSVARQGGSIFWKVTVAVFAVALVATIYFPYQQRKQEEHLRKLSRLHLVDIYLAQEFFRDARGYYTSDPESLIGYINNVRSMRIDTLDIGRYHAAHDSIRETDLWKIVEPRERIFRFYHSPVDSSRYVMIVRREGQSIIVRDPHGHGRIEDGVASWLEGRRKR